MRRDIAFYLDAPVKDVYEAYLNAASGKPFERDCEQKPYYSLSFGVNYSMKYNMNGGACTIHFMPYGNGTAVNMRFSIAQVFGARYEKYAEDLNEIVQLILRMRPRQTEIDVEEFLRPENQVTPQTLRGNSVPVFAPTEPAPAPQPEPQPIPQIAPQPIQGGGFCTNCGGPLNPGSKFCTKCGSRVLTSKTCPNCHAQAEPEDMFCGNCGTRL